MDGWWRDKEVNGRSASRDHADNAHGLLKGTTQASLHGAGAADTRHSVLIRVPRSVCSLSLSHLTAL